LRVAHPKKLEGENMRKGRFGSAHTRRDFLVTTAAAAGATALPFAPARAAAKYTRYDATSTEGRKMLASYAKAVEAMLKLPADDPQNWFRTAFIHLMDCPHGNWWFYVWHRGFLGYFETTIRKYSGDDTFAMPYWDWTTLPRIPPSMFADVLTPVYKAFAPYTSSLATFTSFIKPAMTTYWNSLSPAQRAQLNIRGYNTFESMWNDVTGNGVPGNMAFAVTSNARYLSPGNPNLDAATKDAVAPKTIRSGLRPIHFYDASVSQSFTSSKTTSHNSPAGSFSVLEGSPHNLVHNCIGGVGPLDPGPYGNMTNFLSPVDPIFFLHHSNMDRLWDVWTRKQQKLGLPYLPKGADLKTLSIEPFLFYVDAGGLVGPRKAGDFLSTSVFDYDYGPGGFGETLARTPGPALTATHAAPLIRGSVSGNTGSVAVPRAAMQRHLLANAAAPAPILEVTLARPVGASASREFDVLVGAPAGVTNAAPGSPYYAGTIAFFGPLMAGMKMPDVTFAVPLPSTLHAFTAMSAASSQTLTVRVVPTHRGAAPTLKALAVGGV
jgi:tyrosinase